MSGAPVPGVVNVHQGITPGGSPQVLSVKALRNTEKKVLTVCRANRYVQLYCNKIKGKPEVVESGEELSPRLIQSGQIVFCYSIHAKYK